MWYVGDTKDCNKCPSKIEFASIINYERLTPENLVSMFYGLEAVIDITHIPMNKAVTMTGFDEVKIFIKHLPFELVITGCNIRKWYVILLSALVYGK